MGLPMEAKKSRVLSTCWGTRPNRDRPPRQAQAQSRSLVTRSSILVRVEKGVKNFSRQGKGDSE